MTERWKDAIAEGQHTEFFARVDWLLDQFEKRWYAETGVKLDIRVYSYNVDEYACAVTLKLFFPTDVCDFADLNYKVIRVNEMNTDHLYQEALLYLMDAINKADNSRLDSIFRKVNGLLGVAIRTSLDASQFSKFVNVRCPFANRWIPTSPYAEGIPSTVSPTRADNCTAK